MTPRKWRWARAFGEVIRLLLPFLPASHNIRKEGQERESILVVEYWNIGDLVILFPVYWIYYRPRETGQKREFSN